MKTGKHFVVVKKLSAKKVNDNSVTETFDVSEIAKTLGKVEVDYDSTHVKYENDNVFLIIVCKDTSKGNNITVSNGSDLLDDD